MITKLLGKKHTQFLFQVVAALVVVYIILFLIHSLNCSSSKRDDDVYDANSIPARLKMGAPDKDGRIQFFASFDSKDLLRVWNSRDKKLTDADPAKIVGKPPSVEITLRDSTTCEDTSIEWILYVISAPENTLRRTLLRETWADKNLLRSDKTHIIFLVGLTLDNLIQDKLVEESKQHKDIVQGDFEDTPKSKTLKVILGMKWISEHCSQAKYALKANDDSFINIFGMMSLIKSNLITNRTVLCPLWADNTMPIQRDPQKCGDWCVRDDEFPGRTHFPQYCAGTGFISTVPLLKEMYKASLTTQFFWIEDVYITGLLPLNLAKPVDFINIHSSFSLDMDIIKSQYFDDKNDVEIFVFQVTDSTLFKKLWKSLINRLPPNWFSQLSDAVIARNA